MSETCQVCGATATVHLTEIRGGKRFEYHMCEEHAETLDNGTSFRRPIPEYRPPLLGRYRPGAAKGDRMKWEG